jgi:hypothetical protein
MKLHVIIIVTLSWAAALKAETNKYTGKSAEYLALSMASKTEDPKLQVAAIRLVVLADTYANEYSARPNPISYLSEIRQRAQKVCSMIDGDDAWKEWLINVLYAATVTLMEREGIIPPQGIMVPEF